MSAVSGAIAAALAVVGLEIIVGSRGGPAAVGGILSTATGFVDHVADPNVAAIPNRADQKK